MSPEPETKSPYVTTKNLVEHEGFEFPYYVLRTDPDSSITTAIYTGIHGDEKEVIDLSIKKIADFVRLNALPNALFVPFANPAALATHTRRDETSLIGHPFDLNREMLDPPKYPLARAHQQLLMDQRNHQDEPLDIFVAIHEDLEFAGIGDQDGFYMYVEGDLPQASQNLKQRIVRFMRSAKAIFPLHEGWDNYSFHPDPTWDSFVRRGVIVRPASLSQTIYPPQVSWRHRQADRRGYLFHLYDHYQFDENGKVVSSLDGSIEDWVVSHNIARLAVTIEVPGKASAQKKDSLVSAVFTHLIAQ